VCSIGTASFAVRVRILLRRLSVMARDRVQHADATYSANRFLSTVDRNIPAQIVIRSISYSSGTLASG
jgi:hypothetical protein